jgi:general secretion pathway protein H
VVWRSTPTGFVFDGLPANSLPHAWLDSSTTVAEASRLELGPEPIVAAQSVILRNTQQPAVAWRVQTDGLRPFAIRLAATPDAGAGAAP